MKVAGGLVGAWFGGVTAHIAGMVLGLGADPLMALSGVALGFAVGYVITSRVARRLVEAEEALEREILLGAYSVRFGESAELVGLARGGESWVAEESLVDLEELVEDHGFQVWALAKSLAERMTRRRVEVQLVVTDEGVPVYVYPENSLVEIGDEEEDTISATAGEGGVINVTVDGGSFAALARSVRDGERLEIKTQDALEALYRLAKALSEAIHGRGNPLNAYTAYKAIENLEEEGVISIDPDLKARLPLEDDETRSRIREQVRQEKLAGGEART